MLAGVVRHRDLAWELVKRDFLGRYRGSIVGVAWSLFHPLLMLTIYTFVFSVAFKARWAGSGDDDRIGFAIVLFSGMIVHGFFAECLTRSPDLIRSHPNYVKKVVFPLEVLPWMVVASALLHFAVSFVVLLGFCLFAGVRIHPTALLVPVVLLPLLLMTIGLTLAFAALGVYLRDLAQGMGAIANVLLFLSPVFYPLEALPPAYRGLIEWNPITLPVTQLRDVLLWGRGVAWGSWALALAVGALVCMLGYAWFQKTRKGFADVV
jgi:lipopolysaccharide transport system permease protein